MGFPIDSHFEGWVSYHSLPLREIGQYYDVESDALVVDYSDSEDGECDAQPSYLQSMD